MSYTGEDNTGIDIALLEAQRVSTLKALLRDGIFLFLIILVSLLVLQYSIAHRFLELLVPTFFFMLFPLFFVGLDIHEKWSAYKKSLVQLLKHFLASYAGAGRNINMPEALRQSYIMGRFTDWDTHQSCQGKYKDAAFKLVALELAYSPGNYYRCHWRIFEGIVLIFRTENPFIERVIVSYGGNYLSGVQIFSLSLYLVPALFVWGGFYFTKFLLFLPLAVFVLCMLGWVLYTFTNKHVSKVKLINSEAAKKYKVFSQNAGYANFLVNGELLFVIQRLVGVFGAKSWKCSCFQDKLVISFPGVNSLVPCGSVFSRITQNKFISIRQQAEAVIDMCSFLSHNKK